jgi:hypothetical protein
MKTKNYTHNGIEFGYSPPHRKWAFRFNGNTFLAPCVGNGVNTARKVATQIAGALKRSGEIDNLARRHIANITSQN